MTTSKPRYTVYECDEAGSPWDICQTDDPAEALKAIRTARAARVGKSYHPFGLYLTDDPERGDMEQELEEDEYERSHP